MTLSVRRIEFIKMGQGHQFSYSLYIYFFTFFKKVKAHMVQYVFCSVVERFFVGRVSMARYWPEPGPLDGFLRCVNSFSLDASRYQVGQVHVGQHFIEIGGPRV